MQSECTTAGTGGQDPIAWINDGGGLEAAFKGSSAGDCASTSVSPTSPQPTPRALDAINPNLSWLVCKGGVQ
jgi:hypothetical protein